MFSKLSLCGPLNVGMPACCIVLLHAAQFRVIAPDKSSLFVMFRNHLTKSFCATSERTNFHVIVSLLALVFDTQRWGF